ncbi:hypothetical protein HK098_001551 [Nowakowskiella sp. JEL0407]|nr:hypothetical protein HK098_001551 [Nowakowskiella sp. JEL0407]
MANTYEFENIIDEFCEKYFDFESLKLQKLANNVPISTSISTPFLPDINDELNSTPQSTSATDGKYPQNYPTSLYIFDFDSTLFRSPLPNHELWSSELHGSLIGDCGWFKERRTLAAPHIPEVPDESWFDVKIKDKVLKLLSERKVKKSEEEGDDDDGEWVSDSIVVLMTGRRLDLFGERIISICKSLKPVPLNFDLFFFREGYDITNPTTYFPATLDFKLAVLSKLLTAIPSITHLELFDDRARHLDIFDQEFTRYVQKSILSTYKIHYVVHDPTLDKYIPEHLEMELVEELIEKSNQRVINAMQSAEREKMKATQELTIGSGSLEPEPFLEEKECGAFVEAPKAIAVRKIKKEEDSLFKKIRRTSASMFRDLMELVDEVSHTVIILDEESRQKLLQRFEVPKFEMPKIGSRQNLATVEEDGDEHVDSYQYGPDTWRVHANQMVISRGKARKYNLDCMGGLGSTVRLRVIAVGENPNKVVAVKVELADEIQIPEEEEIVDSTAATPAPDTDAGGLPPRAKKFRLSDEKVAQVVLYMSPIARTRDAQNISEWKEISDVEELKIQGTIEEKNVIGLRRLPNTVSTCVDCAAISEEARIASELANVRVGGGSSDQQHKKPARTLFQTCAFHRSPATTLYRAPSMSSQSNLIGTSFPGSPTMQSPNRGGSVTGNIVIRRLITKHYPKLTIEQNAAALRKVQEWMDKSFVQSSNTAVIEWFISGLDIEAISKEVV